MKKFLWMTPIILMSAIILISPAAANAKDAKYGGILKLVYDKPATSFGFPPKIRAVDQNYASVALEAPMITDTKTGKIYPHLATSWELAEDGMSWIIKLREGVVFHDGTPFDAKAFKFNMDLWISKPTGAFEVLTSAEVIDSHTVRLNASSYYSLIPYELATEAYMVSPKAITENGEKWAESNPVGTGPFKFVSYDRPNKLTWTRFDQYWQEGLPYLDGVEYLIIRDPMTAISSLKGGEVNGQYYAHPQHADTMKKDGWTVLYDNPVGLHIYGDSINPDSPWANKKVRQAVDYAIDKEAIMSQLGLGYYKPLYQIVKPSNPAYVEGLVERKYDPKKAKQLLKEAGYPKGFKSDFIYLNVSWVEAWQAIQANLSMVGVTLNLKPVDRPKYVTIRFQKGNLPAKSAAQMVVSQTANALYMSRALLSSKTPHVPEMKRPEGFDALIDSAISEKDPQKRLEMTRDVVKMAHEDAMYIPFYAEGVIAIMSPKIKDYDLFGYQPTVCSYINTYIEK